MRAKPDIEEAMRDIILRVQLHGGYSPDLSMLSERLRVPASALYKTYRRLKRARLFDPDYQATPRPAALTGTHFFGEW